VVVVAFDSMVSEPCAYNISMNQRLAGSTTANWLADKLHGKGKIIMVTGVPGTSVDRDRTAAAKEVFAKYPDIKIVAEVVGMWSESVARTELSKVLATRKWDDIDGVWTQVGCYAVNSMQIEAGKTPAQLLPCSGESSNGGRVQMLPLNTVVDGATGTYRPLGAPRISYAAPPTTGPLALKLAYDVLAGKKVPKNTTIPLPVITNAQIKLCQTGSYKELATGCNVFKPALVPDPAWFTVIYDKSLPEIGFNAAMYAKPEY
jgi:ribose transport system substrate-binding protein